MLRNRLDCCLFVSLALWESGGPGNGAKSQIVRKIQGILDPKVFSAPAGCLWRDRQATIPIDRIFPRGGVNSRYCSRR